MKLYRSLQFRVIVGIVLVLSPFVLFISYHNFYSIQVIRSQVAASMNDMMSLYMEEKMDKTLEDVGNYLLTRAGSDPDILSLNRYSPEDGEYHLTKIRIANRFREDQTLYNSIDTFFIYSRKDNDLVTVKGNAQRYPAIQEQMRADENAGNSKWHILRNGDHYGLMMRVVVNRDIIIGAWINLNQLVAPFHQLNLGGGGEALFMDNNGMPLTRSTLSVPDLPSILAVTGGEEQPYLIVEQPDQNYLMVGTKSLRSDIRLIALAPEKQLQQQLPFFQWVAWLMPVSAALIFILFLYLLKQVLFYPLGALIRGMRRIIKGDLSFRLEEGKSNELSFLAKTFNHMVEQISQLKIDVYEEQLRVQKAEFKHLQVQINPHFYLNCLNIIYNLAALKQYKNVQKMSLHLANYFKFTIRTNRTSVSVDEEIQHIKNYLEIHKLRFPDELDYRIELSPACAAMDIPPLTIQPFVENAIIHGMYAGARPFLIEIEIAQAEEEPEHTDIIIRDNGKGFAADYLEKLGADEYVSESKGEHIGIWNVQRRLMLSFGPDVRVRFANREDGGAIVSIRLPAQASK